MLAGTASFSEPCDQQGSVTTIPGERSVSACSTRSARTCLVALARKAVCSPGRPRRAVQAAAESVAEHWRRWCNRSRVRLCPTSRGGRTLCRNHQPYTSSSLRRPDRARRSSGHRGPHADGDYDGTLAGLSYGRPATRGRREWATERRDLARATPTPTEPTTPRCPEHAFPTGNPDPLIRLSRPPAGAGAQLDVSQGWSIQVTLEHSGGMQFSGRVRP